MVHMLHLKSPTEQMAPEVCPGVSERETWWCNQTGDLQDANTCKRNNIFETGTTLNLVIYSSEFHLTSFLLLCVFPYKSRLRSDISGIKSTQFDNSERMLMKKVEVIVSLEIYKIDLKI